MPVIEPSVSHGLSRRSHLREAGSCDEVGVLPVMNERLPTGLGEQK